MHKVVDNTQQKINIPIIYIATTDEFIKNNIKKVAFLGTNTLKKHLF